MTDLKPGTRIETNGFPGGAGFMPVAPERLTICKPRRKNLPLPGPDWYIVQHEDGGRMCMHRSRFRVIDNQ